MELNKLQQLTNQPLELKIPMTMRRITEWYEYWNGQVYISFSGGKDSTVLLDLVRSKYPEVPAVFIDTGLEFPEIKDFVKTIDNVTWLKPKMSFVEVLKKYGYPVISKEQAQCLYSYKHTKSEKVKRKVIFGDKNGHFKLSKKYTPLLESGFDVSNKCCEIMKKKPANIYFKATNRKPFLGIMASESILRTSSWFRYGCNAFEAKTPSSKPMSFWTDKDVWEYIKMKNLPYSKIYDMGYSRTGCVFCGFGLQLEKEPTRLQLLEKTHPKLHDYVLNKLGLKEILDFMNAECKCKIKYNNSNNQQNLFGDENGTE